MSDEATEDSGGYGHNVRVRLAVAVLSREVLAVVDRDDKGTDGLGVWSAAGDEVRSDFKLHLSNTDEPPMAAPESISCRLSVMLFGATNSAVPAAIAILTKDETIGRSRTLGRAASARGQVS